MEKKSFLNVIPVERTIHFDIVNKSDDTEQIVRAKSGDI